MLKKYLIAGLFFVLGISTKMTAQSPAAVPANYNINTKVSYIRAWEATAPVQNPDTLLIRPLKDVKQSTAYFDGLGRPLQTVIKQGSLITNPANPNSSAGAVDVVSAVVYDEFGREKYKYLPFGANNAGSNTSINDGLFKTNPFPQQAQFYNTQLSGQPGETNVGPAGLNWAYGQTTFEASPLNRIEETFAPGASWVGSAVQTTEIDRRSVKIKYYLNALVDSVKIVSVTDVVGNWGTYTVAGNYATNELYKNITVDEHGKQVIEFKNKEGQVVLKKVQHTAAADTGNGSGHTGWLCTYYVYDVLNRLRLVIQPRAVEHLVTANWSSGTLTNILLHLSFRYEYDDRGRMIRKKVPDGGEVWMVYDARDRLVLTQDRNMRTGYRGWMYTKYDDLNRPIATGFIPDTVNNQNLAYHVDAAWNSTNYPDLSNYAEDEFTHTFYDNYNWLSNYTTPLTSTYNTNYDSYLLSASASHPYPQANTPSARLRGQVTGTRIRVVGNAVSYLYTVNIYDDKGRTIQTKATNITNGEDVTTTQYAWNGQPLVVVQKQQKAGINPQTHTTVTKLTYDDLGRLLTTTKTVNSTIGAKTYSKPEQVIVKNEYDALGQLKTKKLGAEGTPLETLTYDYNIRGWMLGSNRNYTKDTNSTTNRFGFELAYDKKDLSVNGVSDPYADNLFNGNIAGMLWKSAGDSRVRRYDFTYDPVNRLTNAHFKQFTGSTFNLNAGIDFSATGLSYDANGNILSMNQRGWKPGGSVVIDSLLYNYYSVSNKLMNVIDRVNDTATTLGDFRASGMYMRTLSGGKTNTTVDYTYEANGHLSTDRNKDMEGGILYNQLQLVRYVQVRAPGGGIKGGITYTYDALGNKLKKEVQETGKPTQTTLYLGGAVFENDTLQFIGHEEGRLRFTKRRFTNGDSAYQFQYDYFLKDHLGNVRMVLTEQTDTAQYMATMEAAYRTKENQLFYNIPPSNYPTALVPGGYPADGTTSPNDSLARVNGSGNKIGPAIVLKVMSGDKVDIGVKSFYRGSGTVGAPADPVPDIVAALATGIIGVAGESKGALTALNNSNGPLAGALNRFRDGHNSTPLGKPKAYLNWVLLDEQLQYVPGSSGADPIQDTGVIRTLTSGGPVTMNKNGFLYIYVSNETENRDVFFDNLSVQHITGPIIEETHYYPFGLTMTGISSKALKQDYAENKFKYNSIEQNTDFDLNIGETFFRTHDSQLGRWWQIDPKPNEMLSPYAAMANNPNLYSDPVGDTTWVYSRNGQFLGVVNDGLENQVHFMSGNGGKKIFNASGLNAQAANKLGQKFRDNSMAFIGKNTVSDAKSIEKNATGLSAELAFVGVIEKDKEIRLSQIPMDENNQPATVDNMDKVLDKNYSKEEQANIFLVGHVHHGKLSVEDGIKTEFSGDQFVSDKLIIYGRPSGPRTSSSGDYGPYLYRSPTASQRGQSAAMIVSPYGFTLYGTASYSAISTSGPYHTENRIIPGRESYFRYKQIK